MAENFDDFEFKPLTEGLGFHKKSPQNQIPVRENQLQARVATVDPVSMPTPLERKTERSNPFLNTTLPREAKYNVPKYGAKKFSVGPTVEPKAPAPAPTPATPKQSPTPSTIGPTEVSISKSIDFSLNHKKPFDFDSVSYIPSHGNIGAFFFDLIATIGIACLFAMSLMLVGDVDIFKVFSTITFDIGMQVGTLLLAISVMMLYLVLSRSFFGSTLGEWIFDLQLGRKQDQDKVLYPIRVLWRSVLITLTGIIILPLLSMIFQKDIVARICGLELYKR